MNILKPIIALFVAVMIPSTAWAADPMGVHGKRLLLFLGIVFLVTIYLLIANNKINKTIGWVLMACGVVYSAIAAAFVLNAMTFGILFGDNYGLINPYSSSSSLYQPWERVATKLKADTKYREYYKKNKKGMLDFGAVYFMIANGLKKVDDSLVDKYINTVTAVINKMDQPHCAMLMKWQDSNGGEFTKVFYSTLEKLDQEYINDWFDMAYGAVMAQVDGLPAIRVSQTSYEIALNKMVDSWPMEDEQRMVNVMTHLKSVDDRNVCWAGRLFFGSIAELNQPYREQLIRFIMTSKNPD